MYECYINDTVAVGVAGEHFGINAVELKLDSSIEYVGFLLAISMYEYNMNDTVAVGVAGEHPGGG